MSKDIWRQRLELATALCESVGIDPGDCMDISLSLKQDGTTEVVARLMPRDLRPLTELIRRMELFPEVAADFARQIEPGIFETTAVDAESVSRIAVPE